MRNARDISVEELRGYLALHGLRVSDQAVACPQCGHPINRVNDPVVNYIEENRTLRAKGCMYALGAIFLWAGVFLFSSLQGASRTLPADTLFALVAMAVLLILLAIGLLVIANKSFIKKWK